MGASQQFGRAALNGMLYALPVHVFCFDSDLICRYAAPIGPHFLGTHRDELLGKPIEVIFPADLALRPEIEAVLRTSESWYAAHLPYPPGPAGAWEAGAWQMHAQPYAPPRRGAASRDSRVTAQPGAVSERHAPAAVLVSCIEQHPATPALPDRTAMSNHRNDCNAPDARTERVAALIERVRTKLTIVRGFAQLLRRRQQRADAAVDLHELDRISEAVRELDELLYRFEDGGTWPSG